MKPWLTKVGRYAVERIDVPDAFAVPADLNDPPAAVLHTIEGSLADGLSVFRQHYAPHFAIGPGRIVQMLPVGLIGLSLMEHNNRALIQVEVEGRSSQQPWMFPDEIADVVAALMAACRAEYGIPLTRAWPDSVYGRAYASDPHRNGGQFGTVAGWFGHGDVPAPDQHWDPGALLWSDLFALAAAIDHAPSVPTAPKPAPCPIAFDLTTTWGVLAALDKLGYPNPVEAFQAKHGLAADGDPGPLTQAAIGKELSGG